MYFTEEHELIRKLARDFAEKELTNEILDQVEESGVFPQEILDKMAKAGFYGIKTPKEYGGAGADTRAYVLVMEEIARVRRCLGKNETLDIKKAAMILMDDFRSGKLGKLTLELPE